MYRLRARFPSSSSPSLTLAVQIKGLWMGQGEGRRGTKGEGSESMELLNKGVKGS